MKNILLTTFLTAIFASGALGQSVSIGFSSTGDFGGNHTPVYSMDSLWQFGIPTKPEFEWQEGSWGPYKLCTDTTEYIADTGRWEMYFGVSRDTLDFINNCLYWVYFNTFKAKFSGVPDSTGLLIEVSPDSVHWYNLLDSEDEAAYIAHTGIASGFDSQWWIDTVGYLDGEPVWFPNSEWIDQFNVHLSHDWTLEDAGSVMESHLRLTYISKTTTPHAGIAFVSPEIFFYIWCEGLGIEETRGNLQAKLYPNPVTVCSKFELPENTQYPVHLTIMDPAGRVLYRHTERQQQIIPFPRINLGEGVYIYSIVDAGRNFLSGKFIIEQ